MDSTFLSPSDSGVRVGKDRFFHVLATFLVSGNYPPNLTDARSKINDG